MELKKALNYYLDYCLRWNLKANDYNNFKHWYKYLYGGIKLNERYKEINGGQKNVL